MPEALSLFYSWQALIVVIAATGITKLVTTTLEVARLVSEKQADRPAWVTRLLYPLLPIVIGAIVAATVPLRPDFLEEHVAKYVESVWGVALSYAAWGAACGQFAAYLYDQLRAQLKRGD